jgi:hypothetical protein
VVELVPGPTHMLSEKGIVGCFIVKYGFLWLYIEIHVYEGNVWTVGRVLHKNGSVESLLTQDSSEFLKSCV